MDNSFWDFGSRMSLRNFIWFVLNCAVFCTTCACLYFQKPDLSDTETFPQGKILTFKHDSLSNTSFYFLGWKQDQITSEKNIALWERTHHSQKVSQILDWDENLIVAAKWSTNWVQFVKPIQDPKYQIRKDRWFSAPLEMQGNEKEQNVISYIISRVHILNPKSQKKGLSFHCIFPV